MVLPGSILPKPTKGEKCDNHPDRLAEHCIAGECDSLGYETIYQCKECHEASLKRKNKPMKGDCDICKCYDTDLRHIRDPEEGLSGPVYQACPKCCSNILSGYEED